MGEFKSRDGLDGVTLGHAGAGYHLEFARKHGHEAGRTPDEGNSLVFYVTDTEEWEKAVRRMEALGYHAVKPSDPCCVKAGKTFAYPDGYRVVLQNAAWPS